METDYKELYEKLKARIDERTQYWKEKFAERYSPESEARWSELRNLQAYIIGLEKS
jgi:hypothetical protein